MRRQRGIHLHRDHARNTGEQLFGKRPLAGSDFDHLLGARRARGVGNAIKNAAAREEMLSEFSPDGEFPGCRSDSECGELR